jgi:hypothetical protein
VNISARSILTAGIATIGATAIVIAPSVAPPAPSAHQTVELAAQSRGLVERQSFAVFVAATQQRLQNENAAAAPIGNGVAPTLVAFPGISQAIKDVYNFAEYWVAYGVDVADYVLGWIPFGYLIGDQIQIFYTSLEPIARSITYNIADWIGGSVSFGQGVRNVIRDSINAGIGLANAEIRWAWGFLPPLPIGPPQIPTLPWFGLQQASALDVAARESVLTEPGDVTAPRGPIGAISKVVGELTKGFTQEKPLPVPVKDEVEGVEETDQGPVEDTTPKRLTRPLVASSNVSKGLVRAQGEVRGAITEAVTAVANAAETRGRGSVRDAGAAAPKTLAKGLRAGGSRVAGSLQKIAGNLQKAADETGAAVRSAPAGSGGEKKASN